MNNPLRMVQVLLFRDDEKSAEFGPALWAALKEVEAFYNHDEQRVSVVRHYLAAEVPVDIRKELDLPKENWRALAGALRDDRQWEAVQGDYRRTCDQKKLSAWARELTQLASGEGHLLLVTDQEITPPEGWRYILWSGGGRGDLVVSTAPIDPRYWGDPDTDPVTMVKQGTRVACLSAVGKWLGLDRCENPFCFMFSQVDSVRNLEQMVYLGKEHNLPELALRGFARPNARHPSRVQRVRPLGPDLGGDDES